MTDIFQPQVAQINSAVTPQEGVADTSAVDLFTDVAKAATQATFSFTGQQELSDLRGKFDRIVQARQAGGSSSALQAKARASLDEARASTPWAAAEAEKMFRDTFSGGSTSGAFSATPEEKAQEKHLQKVEEVRLSLGLSSPEEAQKRITLDENAKSAKVQADSQKDVREYNGELVFSNTQAQLNNNSIKFMDAINRTMVQGGGTLSNDSTRSLNLTVDQTIVQLKQELNTQTRDQETGHLLIGKAGYDANLKEIEEWGANTKAMVADQSYTKIIQGLNTEQNAEINFIATKKYRTLKILNEAGGQSAVNAYLVAAKRPEGAAKQLLIGANPIAKDMFKQPGSFNQAGTDGLDKILLTTPTNIFVSDAEAMATGTMLNDPANAKVTTTTMEAVATEDNAVEPYKKVIQKNPDSSAMLWSSAFKSWASTEPAKAKKVLTHGIDALKTSFLSAYVSENGKAPSNFELRMGEVRGSTESAKAGSGLFSAGGTKSLPSNRVVGEGVSYESASILFNMQKVYAANPAQLDAVSKQAGEPLTAAQAVRYTVLGALPSAQVPEEENKVTGLGALENLLNEPAFLLSDAIEGFNKEHLEKALKLAKTPEEIAKLADALAKRSGTSTRERLTNKPEVK